MFHLQSSDKLTKNGECLKLTSEAAEEQNKTQQENAQFNSLTQLISEIHRVFSVSFSRQYVIYIYRTLNTDNFVNENYTNIYFNGKKIVHPDKEIFLRFKDTTNTFYIGFCNRYCKNYFHVQSKVVTNVLRKIQLTAVVL